MAKLKMLTFLVMLLTIIGIIVFLISNSNINKQQAIKIANSYVDNERPSFLLDHAFKIDTKEEKISDFHFKKDFEGIVWYLTFIQDADKTAVFYVNAQNGELLRGYVINRNGQLTRTFK